MPEPTLSPKPDLTRDHAGSRRPRPLVRDAVTYDLFSWALKHNQAARNKRGGRIKVTSRSFEPNGLKAPTLRDRRAARFNNYFELNSQIRRSQRGRYELNVHRNRLLFMFVLFALVIYSLISLWN